MSAGGKPRLLMIFPGPLYDLRAALAGRLTQLSERYAGAVLAIGERAERATVGEFEVELVEPSGRGLLSGFEQLLRSATERVTQAASRGSPFDGVVTYDPLKTGLVGWLVARRRRIPLITEVNGDYGNAAVFSDIPNPFVRTLKRHAFRLVQRFILRRAAGIKLLFPTQLDGIGGPTRAAVIRVFPDYVDLREFRNLGETPEVLFVGHPFYLKGVDVLIAAFKRVADQFPEWRLKILGWYPDPGQLLAAVDGHPAITVHPPVAHRLVAEHMGRCGIFVLPSRTEAMGRVLLEAAACAKPRIGARVGGIPTVIRDEVDGLLFASEDVGDLARQLARLMADPALRRALGEAGARRQGEEFSADAYADSVHEFYSAVISPSRS